MSLFRDELRGSKPPKLGVYWDLVDLDTYEIEAINLESVDQQGAAMGVETHLIWSFPIAKV